MNDNTTKLLEQLAAKLGTTTEYLWRVLLKQAPIEATTTLIQCIIVWIGGIVLYKLHKRFSKKIQTGGYSENAYDKHEVALILPMVIVAIVWGVMFLVTFFCMSDIIVGYFNPEYWALKEVLDSVK